MSERRQREVRQQARVARVLGVAGVVALLLVGWLAPWTSASQEEHWAFRAPVRPAVPAPGLKAWVRNPIDAFVLARLEREGLTPSARAGRETLLRRLSLDLIGLPPTPEEVERFLADTRPDAYDREVDRLLASPHFGERWGRLWLDAARYADSDGYEKDKVRWAWFYRDWVIRAINADLPYDQFIIEQIAGDLLPGATQDQVVATGFLRNSMINEEGGIDPEQFRMEAMFDRMDAIGKGVLGLTIQCAQCHNHKYDPLKQEEYYQLFAFLNNAHEANIAVYTPEEQQRRNEIEQATRMIEARLQEQTPDWQARLAVWEAQVSKGLPAWTVAQATVDDISTGGQRYLPMEDGSFLAQGYAPTKHRVKLTVETAEREIRAFRLELMLDPNLPLGGPGRSIKGMGALTEFEVEAAPRSDPAKKEKVRLVKATADYSQPERPLEAIFDDRSKRKRMTGPVEWAIDGRDETAWGIDAGPGQRNVPRQAVFVAEKPISFEGGTVLTFYLKQNHGGWNSDDNQNLNLGRIRISTTSAEGAVADPIAPGVRQIFAIPAERRSEAQVRTVFRTWRTTVPAWQAENEEIASRWQGYPEGTSQLVYSERKASEARETYQLRRGDFLRREKQVAAGVPAFLHPLATEGNGQEARVDRLTLAKWLVDRRSPTTARSIVNRLWQAYFGVGIVASAEDFGRQSDPPSHPELLDWLAVELMEQGWSLKRIHRLIVTSETYRQSSAVSPALLERDPENRLLARGTRMRVDGEIIRDVTLAASGLLDRRVGGPSVFPPSPEFLYLPPASYGPKVWVESTGGDRYRRALYTFRYRSVPHPVLQNFDTPNGDSACVRRSRSNTPLQALTALNEPLFVEAARALAWRTVREGGMTMRSRLRFAFQHVLGRSPSLEEAKILSELLDRQHLRFQKGEANPWNLATDHPERPNLLPPGVRMEEVAAWTAVTRVLFNLDEAITRE
jgi:hypothetical protein